LVQRHQLCDVTTVVPFVRLGIVDGARQAHHAVGVLNGIGAKQFLQRRIGRPYLIGGSTAVELEIQMPPGMGYGPRGYNNRRKKPLILEDCSYARIVAISIVFAPRVGGSKEVVPTCPAAVGPLAVA